MTEREIDHIYKEMENLRNDMKDGFSELKKLITDSNESNKTLYAGKWVEAAVSKKADSWVEQPFEYAVRIIGGIIIVGLIALLFKNNILSFNITNI
jgi:hypothetical protein